MPGDRRRIRIAAGSGDSDIRQLPDPPVRPNQRDDLFRSRDHRVRVVIGAAGDRRPDPHRHTGRGRTGHRRVPEGRRSRRNRHRGNRAIDQPGGGGQFRTDFHTDAPGELVKVHAAVARALRDNGVDTMFGLLGDANMRYISDYIDLEGGRYIGAVDERGAVMMAQGYARVGNRLGVASITHGPAVTNALTSLTEAARSRTPIVVLTGAPPAVRGHLQHIDLPGLVAPTGAAYQRVHNPSEVFDAVATAARSALITRRPVLLDVPVDLLGADVDDSGTRARAARAHATSPGEDALDRALGVIASARRPLVLAGRGAVSAQARKELLLLADTLGAPVATTLLAHDFFRGEPFNLGVLGTLAQPPAVEILAESDCVIAFGAGLNRFTAAEGSAFVGKTVVHVDTDPAAFDTFTAVAAQVLGDARTTPIIMIEQLRAADHRPSAFRSDDMARRIGDHHPRSGYTAAGRKTARGRPPQ